MRTVQITTDMVSANDTVSIPKETDSIVPEQSDIVLTPEVKVMEYLITYYSSERVDAPTSSTRVPITCKIDIKYYNFNDPCRTVFSNSWGKICMENDLVSIEVVEKI